MKTDYYMLITRDALSMDGGLEKAAGEERQAVWVRQPEQRPQTTRGGNNVIDLAAWKAKRELEALEQADWAGEVWDEAWDEADELDWLLETEVTPAVPARRPRREHPTLPLLELAATLSVAGAAAALVLHVLAL